MLRRIAARTVEALVIATLQRLLPNHPSPMAELRRVEVSRAQLVLTLPAAIARLAAPQLVDGEAILPGHDGAAALAVPIHLPTRGGHARIAAGLPDNARPDPVLIAALRRAHAMLAWPCALPTLEAAPASAYNRRMMRLALLAPDIQRAILTGRQGAHCNLAFFMSREIPLGWDDQRRLLG